MTSNKLFISLCVCGGHLTRIITFDDEIKFYSLNFIPRILNGTLFSQRIGFLSHGKRKRRREKRIIQTEFLKGLLIFSFLQHIFDSYNFDNLQENISLHSEHKKFSSSEDFS